MINGRSFTALIFAYNEELYVRDAIEAVACQKGLDRIIFIDDQSTDATMTVVKSLDLDIPIDFFYNPKKGKANAFAYGLSMVDSDFFFVVHGDDQLLPNYIVNIYKYLESQNIEFCYANSILCDIDMNPIREVNVKDYYSSDEIINKNSVGGYLFANTSIISNILPFPDDLSHEDWFMNIKLAICFNGLHVYTPAMFKYRRHPGSDSIRLNKKLSRRSYNLTNRILDEGLITLNTQQLEIMKSINSKHLALSQVMDYLFNDKNSKMPNDFLLCSHFSKYIKIMIVIRWIFGQRVCTSLDSLIINLRR